MGNLHVDNSKEAIVGERPWVGCALLELRTESDAMLPALGRLISAAIGRRVTMAEGGGVATVSDGPCALRIHPVPSYHNVARIQQFIEAANVKDFVAVFKKPNRDICFVTFANRKSQSLAMAELLKLTRPDSTSSYGITDSPYIAETTSQKRQREESVQRSIKRKLRNTGAAEFQITTLKALNDVVAPWFSVTYEEQLARKMGTLQAALTAVISNLRKDYKTTANRYPSLNLKGVARDPVTAQLRNYDTLEVSSSVEVTPKAPSPYMACPIDSLHGWSSGRDGYRNKNDLTVGLNMAKEACVGFIVGRTDGRLVIESACDALPLPPIASRIAADAQRFIRESGHAPFAQSGHEDEATGVWRRVLVRVARTTQQVMISIAADFSRLTAEEAARLKAQIIKEFPADRYVAEEVDGLRWRLQTVVLQHFAGYGNVIPIDVTYECLTGDGNIVEHLGRYAFQIQPSSFFQVNTQAARVLYDLVGEWAVGTESGVTSAQHTILADVCCGTGTIGMALHDRVSEVIGFELVQSAVDDAILNAKRNALDRCRFVVGKAEDTLATVIKERLAAVPSANVVCVVDPPRPGLHKSVIKAIRRCAQIKNLVYVSCNAKSMADDVTALMRPESDKRPGAPFQPIKAALIDMFPHTEHCESILLLTRP